MPPAVFVNLSETSAGRSDSLLRTDARFFIVKSGNVRAVLLDFFLRLHPHSSERHRSQFNYMEACPRLTVDGGEPILMASGTEDFFDGAWYCKCSRSLCVFFRSLKTRLHS